MNQKEVIKKAIETYGEDAQLWMVIEEMSELSKEICKYKRGKDNKENIADEIADVLIMIEQLHVICDIPIETIKKHIEFKIRRLADRLDIEIKDEEEHDK